MTALLELRHVTKTFQRGLLNRQQTVAVDDFSFEVNTEPASITAIVGESGSGKTTLARLLLGVAAPTLGEVLYNGKDLRTLQADVRDTGMPFQVGPRVAPHNGKIRFGLAVS